MEDGLLWPNIFSSIAHRVFVRHLACKEDLKTLFETEILCTNLDWCYYPEENAEVTKIIKNLSSWIWSVCCCQFYLNLAPLSSEQRKLQKKFKVKKCFQRLKGLAAGDSEQWCFVEKCFKTCFDPLPFLYDGEKDEESWKINNIL